MNNENYPSSKFLDITTDISYIYDYYDNVSVKLMACNKNCLVNELSAMLSEYNKLFTYDEGSYYLPATLACMKKFRDVEKELVKALELAERFHEVNDEYDMF